MSIRQLALAFAVVLLAVAATGGGFNVLGIRIGRVDKHARIFSVVVALLLGVFGVFVAPLLTGGSSEQVPPTKLPAEPTSNPAPKSSTASTSQESAKSPPQASNASNQTLGTTGATAKEPDWTRLLAVEPDAVIPNPPPHPVLDGMRMEYQLSIDALDWKIYEYITNGKVTSVQMIHDSSQNYFDYSAAQSYGNSKSDVESDCFGVRYSNFVARLDSDYGATLNIADTSSNRADDLSDASEDCGKAEYVCKKWAVGHQISRHYTLKPGWTVRFDGSLSEVDATQSRSDSPEKITMGRHVISCQWIIAMYSDEVGHE